MHERNILKQGMNGRSGTNPFLPLFTVLICPQMTISPFCDGVSFACTATASSSAARASSSTTDAGSPSWSASSRRRRLQTGRTHTHKNTQKIKGITRPPPSPKACERCRRSLNTGCRRERRSLSLGWEELVSRQRNAPLAPGGGWSLCSSDSFLPKRTRGRPFPSLAPRGFTGPRPVRG